MEVAEIGVIRKASVYFKGERLMSREILGLFPKYFTKKWVFTVF